MFLSVLTDNTPVSKKAKLDAGEITEGKVPPSPVAEASDVVPAPQKANAKAKAKVKAEPKPKKKDQPKTKTKDKASAKKVQAG